MAKKSKIKTPDWILNGEEKKVEKKKGKTFRIRRCPKCNSDDVRVVVGEIGVWECTSCGYRGREIKQEELSEEEFMIYLDEKGEEVA
jgi:Zn ribbon nucleic-acid-binding protein